MHIKKAKKSSDQFLTNVKMKIWYLQKNTGIFHYANIVEQKVLTKVQERLGLNKIYSSNNFRKITSQSFRPYFFTKIARKHGRKLCLYHTSTYQKLDTFDKVTIRQLSSRPIICSTLYPMRDWLWACWIYLCWWNFDHSIMY